MHARTTMSGNGIQKALGARTHERAALGEGVATPRSAEE
jgi:hypothetical protein